MATVREQVVNAVADRFRQILTVNGYNTDVGNSVYVWKDTPFSVDDELPALNIRDESSEIEEHTNVSEIVRLNIRVDIVTANNNPIPTIRAILEDVRKAISVDETFGGLVLYTRMVGDEIDSVSKEDLIASAYVRLYTVYEVPRWGM